jgi:hypothetical protein
VAASSYSVFHTLDGLLDRTKHHVHEEDLEAILQGGSDDGFVLVGTEDRFDHERAICQLDQLFYPAFALLRRSKVGVCERQAAFGSEDFSSDEVGIDDLDLRATSVKQHPKGRVVLGKGGLSSTIDAGHQHKPRRVRAHARARAWRLPRFARLTAVRNACVR